MTKTSPGDDRPASTLFDQKLAEIGGWRGDTLRRIRSLIHRAAPGVIEELKWGDTPVWSLGGILCTGETYKAKVKLTFPKGASLPDPAGLFNSSLDGKVRRAIDIVEGNDIDEAAFTALVGAAVALNASGTRKKKNPTP